MTTHSAPTDRVNRVVLSPAITRAFWSQRRAWNGARVTLTIETEWVPDGTELGLAIYEHDAAEASGEDFIEELAAQKIQDGRCVLEHTIEWDDQTLDEGWLRDGAELEFSFVASIERFALRKKSTPLYVDLGGFRVGR